MAYVGADGSIGIAESLRIRGPYYNSRTVLAKKGKTAYGNPSFFCEGDTRWLLWDTPQGIAIGKFEWDETTPKVTDRKQIGSNSFRAPRIICKNGMYYLWATLSDSQGGIAVGRSRQLDGPYHTSDGISMESRGPVVPTVIPNSEFSCVGNGSDIITDNNNDDWIIYHARTNLAGEMSTVLMLDKIMWDNGWPVMSKLHASVAAQRQPRF